MKITLIKPNIGRMEHSLYIDEGRMEPLQLGVIAGLTPPHIEVALYDDRMEQIPYDDKTDLVAITVETFTARRAYEIAKEFRDRKIPVLMGGFHPTLIPQEVQEHCDSMVLGDAEGIWSEIISDFEKEKKLKPVYKSRPGIGQLGGYIPRRDLFKGKGYLPITLTQFGRGCRYSCNFCAISVFFEKNYFARPVNEVVAEIEKQGRRYLFFVDDNIVAHKEEAKKLFRALIPLKKKWVSQGSIDMLEDEELMELMVKSGCLGNVIGLESINPFDLREMKKTPNIKKFDHYATQVKLLRNYGLQTWAAFTIGHDWETPADVDKTLNFALESKFTFAAYNILMPYPSTALYKKLEEENRLLYDGKWWLHPEYRFNHASFKPKSMSADQLTEAVYKVRKTWNSNLSILKRFIEPQTNMRTLERALIYWTYNPLFKKETFKKHGMHFGLANNKSIN